MEKRTKFVNRNIKGTKTVDADMVMLLLLMCCK